MKNAVSIHFHAVPTMVHFTHLLNRMKVIKRGKMYVVVERIESTYGFAECTKIF